jgi:hypothetical protein
MFCFILKKNFEENCKIIDYIYTKNEFVISIGWNHNPENELYFIRWNYNLRIIYTFLLDGIIT